MSDAEDIRQALERRSRYRRRIHAERTVEERFACFVALQRASFRALLTSPEGYRRFLQRNYSSRRVEVIDGKWRPVSAARCAQQT